MYAVLDDYIYAYILRKTKKDDVWTLNNELKERKTLNNKLKERKQGRFIRGIS